MVEGSVRDRRLRVEALDGRLDLAVLVLLRVLAEVPDVSGRALGVPVVGVLDGCPSSETTSWTTRASIPMILFFLLVTVTSTRSFAPSASLSRYTQRLPGAIGQ